MGNEKEVVIAVGLFSKKLCEERGLSVIKEFRTDYSAEAFAAKNGMRGWF
jgi:hypothetical protein